MKTPEKHASIHESAERHVSGKARYIRDMERPDMLWGVVVRSPLASATGLQIETKKALGIEGVKAILTATDIPGRNNMGAVADDEPCLVDGTISFIGQAIALVAAESRKAAEQAAAAIQLEFEETTPVLSLRDAMEQGQLLAPEREINMGTDIHKALAGSAFTLEGELETGAQEHWYLETQSVICIPEEDHLRLLSSTQHPSETQALVAEVLAMDRNLVQVEAPRLGGAFGGKETQASHLACWAALISRATGRSTRMHFDRRTDMCVTGKRHAFLSHYSAGFNEQGVIQAVDIVLNSDGGASLDLSMAIMERAIFHVDNAYHIPNLRVRGRIWKTNHPPNTAFRGFGGPQGMAVIETIIDRIARKLGLDAAEVRKRNFYGLKERNLTHYGQKVENNRLFRLFDEITVSSAYIKRRKAVDQFNRQHLYKKRGLALSPVKFGISFTTAFLNQAAAMVNIYQDGSVILHHGGVEMGQGLHTKMITVASGTLGVREDKVRVATTNTSIVPNTSATAASSGSDLNGMAVAIACKKLRERLEPVALELLQSEKNEGTNANVTFTDSKVFLQEKEDQGISFARLCRQAYLKQVKLSATGHYRTPDIHFDRDSGKGKPFHYFAFGMAVSEVEVDLLTGMHRNVFTEILHDAGKSLNEAIDLGQVYGGFIQGIGWVSLEEVVWDAEGHLLSDSPDTYKIPTFDDLPEEFRVSLLKNAPNPNTIRQSKAVGEPPFMLALSVWLAIKDALSAAGEHRLEPPYSLPATYEVIANSAEWIRREMQKKKD